MDLQQAVHESRPHDDAGCSVQPPLYPRGRPSSVEPGLDWFDRATFDREDARRLASKVRTEGEPGSLATARVRISGAGRSAVVDVDAPRGSPAHPLSEEEQRAKFHGLVGGVLNASLIDATYAMLKELHRCPDVRALVSQFPAVEVGTADHTKAAAR